MCSQLFPCIFIFRKALLPPGCKQFSHKNLLQVFNGNGFRSGITVFSRVIIRINLYYFIGSQGAKGTF